MNASLTVLPASFDLIKLQCQNTALAVLSAACSSPEFSSNKALQSSLPDIKRSFVAQLEEDFQLLVNDSGYRESRGIIGEVQRRIQALAMVDQEELAFKIKVDEFTERSEIRTGISQALLVMRFEAVLDRELEEEQLPLYGQKLITQFQKAIQPIELDREEKTAFFAHLANSLVRYYDRYLSDANNILIDQNILADLNESDGKARFNKRQQRIESAKKRKALMGSITANLQKDDKGNPILPKMDDLLSQLHLPQACSAHHLMHSTDLESADIASLLLAIDDLQLEKQAALQDGYQQLRSEKLLVQQLQQGAIGGYNLSACDANTISMMSMLYQDLFSNSHIAQPIKAILEQLQGPLLKTALLDKNFFADSGNPAQLLLDKIVELATSWVPDNSPDKDFLYQKMVATAIQVQSDFDGSYEVFEKSVTDLNTFYKNHQHRIERIEARIVTAEKAKARFDRAHEQAGEHIESTFGGFELPPVLSAFMHQQWQHVLFFIHNKYDTADNSEWRKAQACEALLLACLNDKPVADSKKSVLALQQLMLQIGQNKVDVNTALKQIFPVVKPASKKAVVAASAIEPPLKSAIAEELNAAANNAQTESNDQTSDLGLKGQVCFEHDVESSTGQLTEKNILKLQDTLTVGSWLFDDSGEERQKVKIAAYIKHTDTYILVHRNGTRSENLKSEEISQRLQSGSMTVLESALMFDRALESVITSIRTA